MENGWFDSWEQLVDKPEVEFLGVVIDVRPKCNCRYCKEGRKKLEERGETRTANQLHLVIAPLDRNWRLQHVFIDMSSKSKVSRKGCWIHAMTVLQIPYKTPKEFKKFMSSHVIQYKKMAVGDYLKAYAGFTDEQLKNFGNAPNAQVTVPVKIVPKDALELYGLDTETVKEKVKLFKKVWKLLLEGVPEDEAYSKVFGEIAEEMAEEFEEETEEVEEKKTRKTKKEKKEEEEIEEEIEEEDEEIL